MNWSFSRSSKCALASCGMLALLLGIAPSARAEDPALSAQVGCAPVASPGRILCDVTANASLGKLVWVDALVVQAPPFARPLRSRVVAQVEAASTPATASAKLALVASELGTGELALSVRAVVCQEGPSGEWCGPEIVRVSAPVVVGQAPAPAATVPAPAP
jgi:hypothetical protein